MFKLLNSQCLTLLEASKESTSSHWERFQINFQTCQSLDGYIQGYKMFNAIGERMYSNFPAAAITGQQLLLGNYV